MSSDLTILVPQSDNMQSFESVAAIASAFLWGSLELIVSIGFIAAFAHILCFATNLVIRDERSLEASISADVQKKEQTVALMVTGFLTGIHLIIIFFGLPLFGHDSDSFLIKVVLSSALIAVGTSCIVVVGVLLWLVVPAFYYCACSITRRLSSKRGSASLNDLEASVDGDADAEMKQAFLQDSQDSQDSQDPEEKK